MVEIIKSFDKDKNCIIRNMLSGKGYSEPDPNLIFDEGMQDCASALIPASNAIGIVLQHDLKKRPTLHELLKLTHRI